MLHHMIASGNMFMTV